MDIWEVILRLGAAMLAGALLGLNRDRHHKPAGVRTLGLVGLGSAVAVLTVASIGDANGVGRVVQGLVTGIGFLGAGLIMRATDGHDIHGLTTAVCSWITACVGAACGAGEWKVVSVGVGLTFVVLYLGGPIERALHPHAHQSKTIEGAAQGSTEQRED